MRIGIDVREACPHASGQQRYLWRLGAWLAVRGHDVHYITVRDQHACERLPPGTTLHRFARLPRGELKRALTGLDLDAFLINPERSRQFRHLEANVLRAGFGTDQYRQKLRSFRDPWSRGFRSALRATPWTLIERRWERAFYERGVRPPQIVAQSEYMRAQILDSYGVAADRVHVVRNGVDLEEFSPARRLENRAEARARWGIADDTTCLLLLGHNFRLKGLWQALEALGRHGPTAGPPLHLLVAGRGTGPGQVAKAQRLVRAHGLDRAVTLLGNVDPASAALAAADALLHLSWHDSFGFAVLEAMAAGLPVITTPWVGAAELIEEGRSGVVVDPGDITAVGDAIHRLTDPTLRHRMGLEAGIVASGCDEASSFRGMLAVFQRAAAARGRYP
jgi:glycosyltransferase involved in cell wall biosynthesis